MLFARPVTRLAAGNFSFPTPNRGKLGMRRMGEGLELILVAILTGLASDVISRAVIGNCFCLDWLDCL